ncbi:hypothetical protein BDV93DRAFT_239413 [Ceratobasidium sp. AG-I]|nr:hypothetical protein BDV93DRAFT_239413 [Ceratobasidium sp. AG-I]
MPPKCFPILIQMLDRADMGNTTVQRLLNGMMLRIRKEPTTRHLNAAAQDNTPSIEYLNCFTHTNKGFFAFSVAAKRGRSRKIVAGTIAKLVHLAANRHEVVEGAPVELHPPAVPGFLDVVSIVANCSDSPESRGMLLEFSQDVVKVLEVAGQDSGSRRLIAEHTAIDDLYSVLEAIEEKEIAREQLHQVQGLRSKLKIETKE